jgi:hypothetical protein
MASTPVRFPFGVTTASKGTNLGNLGLPDVTKWHVFFDDFHQWVTDTSGEARYTITTIEAGASSATEALVDEPFGAILITNDSADNDSDFLQKIGESFRPAAGKQIFFKARFKVSDATDCDWVFGLMVTDTTPLAADGDGVTDGIFFQKDDGDLNVDFYIQKDATTGQLTNAAVTTSASNDTYMTLGFWFDGKRTVRVYKDDAQVDVIDIGGTFSAFMPDTELTPSFGIQNGSAAARSMTVDYIFAAIER